MKTRLTKYPLSLIACLFTILCFSCVVPTKQPSYFDSHPEVLKKQYTADEINILEKNFEANPLQYSQAVGDMLLYRMHQKSPEFAREFAQTPEIADGVNTQEAKAIASIYDLIKPIEITEDLYEKKGLDSDVHKIIMEWEGNKESDWSGWFLGLGNTPYSTGKVLSAEPIGFEQGDEINYDSLKRYADLKWKSVSREGDPEGIIFELQSPMHKELTFYINGKQLKLTPVDLLKKDLVFDDKDGLDGKLTIKNGYQTNLTPELFAIRDMVLAGEGDYRYSAPLQALLWGYMDGKFKERENPLKDYQGALEFVKPIWGRMEGERWDNVIEVALRMSPELIHYYINEKYVYNWVIGSWRSNQTIFKNKAGACYEVGALGMRMLRLSGHDAKHYWDTEVVSTPDGAPYGHSIISVKVGDRICIPIDFTQSGNQPYRCLDKETFNRRYIPYYRF